MGNESTDWRTGTRGITCPTRCASVCAKRRAPREGQNRHGRVPAEPLMVGTLMLGARSGSRHGALHCEHLLAGVRAKGKR